MHPDFKHGDGLVDTELSGAEQSFAPSSLGNTGSSNMSGDDGGMATIIEDGQWVASKAVTLYANDAGTDSGVDYTSPDSVTTPRGVVTQINGFPAIQNGVIVPFATFTFTRLD